MFDDDAMAAIYDALGAPVMPDVGPSFLGTLGIADVEAFGDAVQAGDYALRYQTSSASLAVGAKLTIGGATYVVAALPRRIGDGRETVAPLVDGTA